MELHDQMFLVPVKVKALIAWGKTGTEFAGPTVNFGVSSQDGAMQIQTEPFTRHSRLEAGIHLHWFLPECLVHGVREAGEKEVTYPFLPDKWIVTRVEIRRGAFADRKILCKSFQVESSSISPVRTPYNQGSILVPTEKGNWYLGRCGEYGRLPAGGAYSGGLTAAGYGEPGFYAYYPNCRNVFGFHDRMDGVAEGSRLFYQICGWYQDRAQDPVDGLSGEELAGELERMGFEFSRSIPKKDFLFWNPQGDGNALLLHGTCYGLEWKRAEDGCESGVPETMPDIAVGNTSLEAFAALVANRSKKMDRKSERLLNAFLGDLLEEWADMDGVIQAEEKIHRDTLQPMDGGRQWDLKKRENVKEIERQVRLCLEGRLEELNLMEEEQEKRRGRLQYWRKETCFAWYRYRRSNQNGVKELAAEQWKEFLQRVVELDREAGRGEAELEEFRQGLREASSRYYELREIPAERFWTPNEPVILLAGTGMEQEYGAAGGGEEKRPLRVRTFAQIVTSIPVPGAGPGKQVEAGYLWSYVSSSAELPEPALRLLKEALLLSPECAPITAYEALLVRGGEAGEEEYREEIKRLGEILSRPWRKEETDPEEYQGILPDKTGVTFFSPPWNPLYMEWGIAYTPDTAGNLDNWELDEIDYSLVKVLPLASPCKYRGRMVLTPHMLQSLSSVVDQRRKRRLEEKEKRGLQPGEPEQEKRGLQPGEPEQGRRGAPDSGPKMKGEGLRSGGPEAEEKEAQCGELEEELKRTFGTFEVLSQRLSGFYANFLTQREVIRGPLKEMWLQDPLIGRYAGEVFDSRQIEEGDRNRILGELDEAADTEPYIGAVFSPLRIGSAKVKELRLIDSFGQVKELVSESEYERQAEIYISEQMDSSLYQQTMVLTPRLIQPSRLTFRWVREEEGIIFGWLVPNYIDGSLMVFDETGRMAGTFLEVDGQAGDSSVKRENAPGQGEGRTNPDLNPRLSDFLKLFEYEMQRRKRSNLSAIRHFVNFLSDELGKMSLPGMAFQKNLMHFVGRPLALADAEIGIETGAPLWRRQTWTRDQEERHVLETLCLPLRLGDQRKRSEGLAGFFKKDGQKDSFYRHFYAFGSSAGTGYIRFDNRIDAPVNRTVRHTLLFDPSQSIHLISGIFPVRQVRMPEAEVLDAQARLNMEMLINPVLGGEGRLRLPLAVLPGKKWSFLPGMGERIEPAQANGFAFEEDYPLTLLEGWLKMEREGGEEEHGDTGAEQ